MNFSRIGQVNGNPVIEDKQGERLALTDEGFHDEPTSCHLLSLLPRALLDHQTLIVRFQHDLDQRLLRVKPLSIVTTSKIVRLTL